MPEIPANPSLNFIATTFLFGGGFLVLAGLGIIKIEKVTIPKGLKTWGTGLILVALGIFLIYPELKNIYASPVATPTTQVACVHHKNTDKETIENLVHMEELAVKNSDLDLIKGIFSTDAIYNNLEQGESLNAIENYKFAFGIHNYTETYHPEFSIEQISDSLAYAISGSSGTYIVLSTNKEKDWYSPFGSDHWTFRKDIQGCWKIEKLSANAQDESFPP